MVRNRISQIGLAITAVAMAAAVSACSQGGTPAAPSEGSGAVPPAPTGGTAAPATPASSADGSSSGGTGSSGGTAQATSAGGSGSAGNGLCKSTDLKLSLQGSDGAAGTVYRSLVFTNTSGHSCVIQGFPGVSYVGGTDGHQIGPAAYRDGTKGAPVTLANGESAYATVGFVTVQNFDTMTCQPQAVKGLRVYPPQETASMYLDFPTTGCGNNQLPGNQLTVKTIQKGTGQ